MVNKLKYKILLCVNALCNHVDGWEVFNEYIDKKSRVSEKIHNYEF